MKRTIILTVAAVAALFALTSCGNKVYKAGDRMPETTDSKVDSVSYAFGLYMSNMLTNSPFGEINLSELYRGFEDGLAGDKQTDIKPEEVGMIIQMHLMQRQAYVAKEQEAAGTEFLLKNKEKEGVVETESGLQYKVLVEGTGISPESADTVEVHYEGRLLDGTVFDSSRERGESIEFALNRVIKGWTEGLTYAKEGGQIELYIPADLAYGKRGSGPIPGNATLIFNIELIKVKKFAAEEEAPVEKANVKKPNVKSQSANPIDKSASKKPTIKK